MPVSREQFWCICCDRNIEDNFEKFTAEIQELLRVAAKYSDFVSKPHNKIVGQLFHFGLWRSQFEKAQLLSEYHQAQPYYWQGTGFVKYCEILFHTVQILYNWSSRFGDRNIGHRGGNGKPGTSEETIQQN